MAAQQEQEQRRGQAAVTRPGQEQRLQLLVGTMAGAQQQCQQRWELEEAGQYLQSLSGLDGWNWDGTTHHLRSEKGSRFAL